MIDADDPRVRMAAERTLLAWIRTGLAVMAFGFVVARHDAPRLDAIVIGFVLLLLGTVAVGLAAREYARVFRGLDPNDRATHRSTALAVWFAAALAAIGFFLVGSLLIRSLADRSVATSFRADQPRRIADSSPERIEVGKMTGPRPQRALVSSAVVMVPRSSLGPGREPTGAGAGPSARARLDPGNGKGIIRPRGMCRRSVPVVVGVIWLWSRAQPRETVPRVARIKVTVERGANVIRLTPEEPRAAGHSVHVGVGSAPGSA